MSLPPKAIFYTIYTDVFMISLTWLSKYCQQVELPSSHCDIQAFQKLQLQRNHLGDHLQTSNLEFGENKHVFYKKKIIEVAYNEIHEIHLYRKKKKL